MRVLLVQPWIADVAAFNFWVRPLGLYALGEWLWERGAEPALVDCLSPAAAPAKFPRAPVPQPHPLASFPRRFARYGISLEEFRARLRTAAPFDAVLVTSATGHWYPGVQWAVAVLRDAAPSAPVLLGGVYPSLWPEHARAHSGADQVLPGSLEQNSPDLASLLGLPAGPVRPRKRWYDLALHDGATYAAVRTARGCPFRCSYCASWLLSPGFEPRGPQDVVSELAALARLGVRDIAFYDDALLVGFESRLLPVLRAAEGLRLPLRFHTPNGIHPRLVTTRVARWLARARFATVRLSLETAAPGRQRFTGDKVSNDDLARAVERLRAAGFPAETLGVYLLLGLPGQPLEEVRAGVELVRSVGVRPYLAEFSPIPGTPEWARLTAAGTIPEDFDPLLANNSIFYRLFSGYEEQTLQTIFRSARQRIDSVIPP
jgi:pyruvate-formate lyase-activating enzyme